MPSAPSLRRLAIGAALLVALAACGTAPAITTGPTAVTPTVAPTAMAMAIPW